MHIWFPWVTRIGSKAFLANKEEQTGRSALFLWKNDENWLKLPEMLPDCNWKMGINVVLCKLTKYNSDYSI